MNTYTITMSNPDKDAQARINELAAQEQANSEIDHTRDIMLYTRLISYIDALKVQVAAEREACAKIAADQIDANGISSAASSWRRCAATIAKLIRARAAIAKARGE